MRILISNSIWLLLIVFIVNLVDCLKLKGLINKNENWIYVGKFCFISKESKVVFNLKYPNLYGTQNLLFYYDDQWSNVYNKPMSCAEKERQLLPNQILNLTVANFAVDCKLDVAVDGSTLVNCSDARSFLSSRPRWWFLVISNCKSDKISIDYDFHFTNGKSVFRKEFSADEFGIFETSIALFLAYLIMVLVGLLFSYVLHKKTLLHITFKLFIISIILEFFSFLFYMSEYANYGVQGISTQGPIVLARIFDAISQMIFMLMLILFAKGYTVVRGRLQKSTLIKLIFIFACYIIAYVVAFLYSEAFYDPGIVNYYYSSPGGIAIIIIKLLFGWLWFLYAVVFTIKNFPEKRLFYIVFSIVFSIWFLAGPFVILASSYIMVDYIRQFVAFLVQSIIAFLGHLFFLILVRPTNENKMFPYHVKTNQIGLMNPPDETQQSNNQLALTDLFTVSPHSFKYMVKNSSNTNMSHDSSTNNQ